MRFVTPTLSLLVTGGLALRMPAIKGLRGPEPDAPVPEGTTEQCTYYFTTSEGEDCVYVESYWGISHDKFVRWNPSVKEDCSGIVADHSYCVEVNNGGDITTSIETTATPTPTGSPAPSPTLDGTAPNCDVYHFVEVGDDCEKICSKYGISMDQFMEWNENVESNCAGLWAEYYFCVSIEGHDADPTVTGGPDPTGTGNPAPSPTLDGTAPDCDAFHFVEKGDNCGTITSEYGISMDQLMEWNTAVESDCSGLWAQYYYCVSVEGHEPSSPPPSPTETGTPGPSPTLDGTHKNCDDYHLVAKGDDCEGITSDYGISMAQFMAWNTRVEEDCSSLWADYYYCVSIEGHNPPPPSATTTKPGDDSDAPAPTQTGIVKDCEDWYVVKSGDDCEKVVAKYGNLDLDLFVKWNPAVGKDCKGLWLGNAYCVGTKGNPATGPSNPPPTGCQENHPTPTQPGAICKCKKWHKIKSGDSCWSLAQKYKVTETQLKNWNKGTNCNMWLDYNVCVQG